MMFIELSKDRKHLNIKFLNSQCLHEALGLILLELFVIFLIFGYLSSTQKYVCIYILKYVSETFVTNICIVYDTN